MSNKTRLDLKKSLPPDIHLPNKNEAKLMRCLRIQTGLTEDQIRGIKKYRVALAKAQKVHRYLTAKERRFRNLVKSITGELKLPKEHPQVIEAIREFIIGKTTRIFWSHYYYDMPKHKEGILALMRKIDRKKAKKNANS